MKIDVTKLPLGEALISFVLMAVIGTFVLAFAFGPGGFARDPFVPEPAETPEATPEPGVTPSPGNGSVVGIAMIPTNQFDTDEIRVPAGEPVTLTADNQDGTIPHNWALYTDDTRSELIVATEICSACTETITFDPPPPGEYFFICDVHPVQMTGTFIVE